MANANPTVDHLFSEALQIATPEERSAYLDIACGNDAELRQRMERLLRAYGDAESFLEVPAPFVDATRDLVPAETLGTQVGAYKLLEQIGEGGMGVVFVAEQYQPVRRKVALKLIKPGMDSREVIARFEAERQALALMDHPNIARVLDAGATASGRPYFVMELVRGVPITQFCDDNRLTPRKRLELFTHVCHAVQHAHHKGIIHRDIKPNNVMVTCQDGQPVVKVIDFGIAKAMGQHLTEKTLFTNFAQMLGTPLYMSPEQAELSSTDVDTRSDIYSLGVLLYELLTGSTPVDKEQLKRAAFDEIRRIIREEDPTKPSTRISTTEAAPSIAAHRQTEPVKLTKLIRGELDWIVMKALEKDRNRRYETASSLRRDVEHYLQDEPVLACPPSAWYRFRKLAQRNRGAFSAASAVALLLLVTMITLAVSNAWIRREQARTKQEKVRAEQAQKLAEQRAEEIHQGLERLKAANALLDRGRWYFHERRWDDAHIAFSKAVQLRPEHVSIWVDRGDLYAKLGLWDLAAADFVREMKLQQPDTPLRWHQHALLCLYGGDTEAWRQTCRKMRERFLGTVHISFVEETVRANTLAPAADFDWARLIVLSQDVVDYQPWSSYSRYLLGITHYRNGEFEQAIQRLNEALSTNEWPNRLLSHPVLAMAHFRLGHAAEAGRALDETARVFDRWTNDRFQSREEYWAIHLGAEAHWDVAWWDWLEFWLLFREAKNLIDGTSPPDDPRLHVLRARSFAGLRLPEMAVADYDAALKLSPQDSQIRLESHRNLGYCSIYKSQWGQAAAEFAQASELAPEDVYLWMFRAICHFLARDVDAYRRSCADMLAQFEQTNDPRTACNVLQACMLLDDAVPEMGRLIPLAKDVAAHGQFSAWTRGAALYRAHRCDESIRCFEGTARLYSRRASNWIFLAMAHHRLGHFGEAHRCLVEATRWIDEADGRINEGNLRGVDDLSGVHPAWGDWHERPVCMLLFREAEDLLKGNPETERREPDTQNSTTQTDS